MVFRNMKKTPYKRIQVTTGDGTIVVANPQKLVDLNIGLLTDASVREAFKKDPRKVLEQAGVSMDPALLNKSLEGLRKFSPPGPPTGTGQPDPLPPMMTVQQMDSLVQSVNGKLGEIADLAPFKTLRGSGDVACWLIVYTAVVVATSVVVVTS